jgi:fructose-1,6-bisphosphatase/inositol monophosphatase family enzyme
VTPFDGERVAALVAETGQGVARMRAAGEVTVVSRTAEGPTTSADLLAQEELANGLLAAFGPAEILAEEGAARRQAADPAAPLTWIIDPIDGTASFLSGSDVYGVQVAAYGGGRLIGGWIACPDLGWQVSAWDGGPFRADVGSRPGTISGTVVAAGDFDPAHLAALRRRGVTRGPGSRSCAVEYALLAAGRLDAALYRRTHPWDHAPGAYLVVRSGGRSVRWDGTAYDPGAAGEGILTVAAGVDLAAARGRLLA